MKTEIPYHLYIGCKVQTVRGIETLFQVSFSNGLSEPPRFECGFPEAETSERDLIYEVGEIKPILRRLSDLTLEEGLKLGWNGEQHFGDWLNKLDYEPLKGNPIFIAEQFLAALSFGIWLFGDQSFTDGDIIDEKTLKQQ